TAPSATGIAAATTNTVLPSPTSTTGTTEVTPTEPLIRPSPSPPAEHPLSTEDPQPPAPEPPPLTLSPFVVETSTSRATPTVTPAVVEATTAPATPHATPATGAPPSELSGHTDFVLEAKFSPDGTLIASASKDGTARVWRVSDGKLVLLLQHGARVNSV